MRKAHILLAFMILMPLLLNACAAQSDRSDKPSPDWSRGLRLGTANARQPVAIQVDSRQHVHLVWSGDGLRYAQLDPEAHVLSAGALPLDLPDPRWPQLLVDRQGNLHLALLSRSEGIQNLYHVPLDPQGQPGDPLLISAPGEDVGSFRIYLAPSGDVAFIWAGEPEPGAQRLVYTTLQDPGHPITLVEQGTDPFVLVDRTGTVHLSWLQPRGYSAQTIYYATLAGSAPDLSLVPAGGLKLADFDVPEGGVYDGPVIGLDTQDVYILWSVQNLGGGLTPTAAFSFYVAFPVGEPQAGNPRSLRLPSESDPTYQDYTAPYGLTKLHLLSAEEPGANSDFVNTPATVSQQQGELPVLVSLVVRSAAESQIQLATAVLSQGEQIGYELVTKTRSGSLLPSIATDSDANLHLAWIDTAGFREFTVYYATNALQPRSWLDRTSTQDVSLRAADLLFGVLSGIGLLPIAGIWAFPALVWVVLFFIFTGQEELERTPARIGFLIAVLVYVGMKLLLLPGLFRGTPLVGLFPQDWATAVGIVVPALILLLALGAVYLHLRRAQRPTIFKAYVIFAGVDVLLTLVLYAPGFFNQP